MKYIYLYLLMVVPCFAGAQIISTFAGGGTSGLGDGGAATSAVLNDPNSGVFDKFGNYYFASAIGANRIREINQFGIITTIAGNGTSGFCGDGGPSTSACLDLPYGVDIDTIGNIYIADHQFPRIRKVEKASGIITTVAGNGQYGYNGDEIPATDAKIWADDVCLDRHGNIYIADFNGRRIRLVNPLGIISTIAGNGVIGSSGDGGPATNATLNPSNIAVDNNDNIFVADPVYNVIRKINNIGIISTIAGNGSWTYSSDNIPATTASFQPYFLCVDNKNDLYIADKLNLMVFMVDSIVFFHHIAGNGLAGYNGDNISALSTSLDYPSGLAVDRCGNLYIAEVNNKRIRKMTFSTNCNDKTINESIKLNTCSLVFPNPTKSSFTISSTQKIKQIIITNFMGEEVYTGVYDIEKAEVNIAGLPEGVYVVRVTDDEGSVMMNKIVKQ